MRLRHLFRTVLMVGAWVVAAAVARADENMTLTSGDGRSMEAIILSYKKDTIRIRRVDTNREFSLPIAQLSAADQTRIRQYTADHPELRETIKPNDVKVLFTRKRVAEKKVKEDDGESQESMTSFNVTLTNRTAEELGDLKVEYTLFVEDDPDNREKTDDETLAARISRRVAVVEVESIKSGQTGSFDTEAIKTLEKNLYRSWLMGPVGAQVVARRSANLAGKWKDQEVFGILIKLYDGDRLIETVSSSDTLAKMEGAPLKSGAQ
jgi:hypothetical protein